jgi:DNA repair protein RadC
MLDKIIAKLRNEGAEALSNSELQRCLGNCIGAFKLIPLAKEYRDNGLLTLNDIL